MISAILRGLSQNASTISQQLPYRRASGNCTFETFPSLSVCGTCNNITSSLTKTILHNEKPLAAYIENFGGNSQNPPGSALYRVNSARYRLPDGNAIWNPDGSGATNLTLSSQDQVTMTAKSKFDLNQMQSFGDDELLFFCTFHHKGGIHCET